MDSFRKRARPSGTEMSNKPPGEAQPKPEIPPKPESQPKPDKAPNEGPPEEAEPGAESAPVEGEEEPTAATPPENAPTPPVDAKGKKVSPWRLVDQYKTKVASLEKELAEIRTSNGKPGELPPEVTEKLTKAEGRVKELEQIVRFTDYQKSGEFQEQYQKPYEAAWARAVQELSEVTVTDSTGTVRPATAEDMLTLVNLPLGKARETADEMFGAFANDAMAHRKAIKELFDKQQTALKEAHTKADEWAKTNAEKLQKLRTEIDKDVGELWTKANADASTDAKYGQYFTPRESDPEWNQRLAKGFELVDRGFADANPRDPRLTQEQRKSVIERHAAIRNRAAAFGPLRYENEQLRTRLEAVEKELAEYKTTEAPQAGGSRSAAKTPSSPADPWASIREGLRKRARPQVM